MWKMLCEGTGVYVSPDVLTMYDKILADFMKEDDYNSYTITILHQLLRSQMSTDLASPQYRQTDNYSKNTGRYRHSRN
jgi:hypothetical protein